MGEVEVYLHAFLTSALDEGEYLALCPSCFTPGESASSTHWIGGWVGPRATLDTEAKKILLPLLRIKLWLSRLQKYLCRQKCDQVPCDSLKSGFCYIWNSFQKLKIETRSYPIGAVLSADHTAGLSTDPCFDVQFMESIQQLWKTGYKWKTTVDEC